MRVKIIRIFIYVIGFFCIIYPIYYKFLSYKNQTEIIFNYNREIESMDKEILEDKINSSEKFNKENSFEIKVVDPSNFSINDTTSSYSFLDVGEVIGTITIPKININLPIYEGVTSNNLLKGVAHMEKTSIPNGNMNTHSVLAGHTGIIQSEIFDNIDKLILGDEFYIYFYGKITKYKVVDKRVVLPDDTSSIKIEDGRCLVTLVTCTPKTINSHRLLVTGEKVVEEGNGMQIINAPEKEEIMQINKESDFEIFINFAMKNIKIFILLIVGVLIYIIIIIIFKVIIRKREK